jgi:hypothetical protein
MLDRSFIEDDSDSGTAVIVTPELVEGLRRLSPKRRRRSLWPLFAFVALFAVLASVAVTRDGVRARLSGLSVRAWGAVDRSSSPGDFASPDPL